MEFLGDPITFLASWLNGVLSGWFPTNPGLVTFIMTLIGAGIVGSFGLGLTIILIWAERKLAGRFQDRIGPNRVGPYGIFQTFADIVKIFTKEDITPAGADKLTYNMAPLISVATVILIWAVIPFSTAWMGTDINVGVLYIVAVGAIGIVSVIMAGWSSNNKYALLGAFRVVAQMVSYEVPMVISLLVPVLLARSMGVHQIVEAQNTFFGTFFWMAPVAALIFFVSSLAEIGRTPFDLIEAESEIVAGFHIEYSGLKFGMFFVGEFLHAFTIAALTAVLFFGGWQGPGAYAYPILGFFWFLLKAFLLYFVVVWIRTTLPRVRIDQMLALNWKILTPLSLAVLILTAVLDTLLVTAQVSDITRSLFLFVMNLLVAGIGFRLVADYLKKRPARKPVGQPRPVARPPQMRAAGE